MKGSDEQVSVGLQGPDPASTKGCPVKGSDYRTLVGKARLAASTKGCPVKGSDRRWP